ncbi:ATP-binding protein, partial [Staphylococcus aureus]
MNNLKWVAYFLKSRMNWIFWILFLNFLMLGISLIDYDFPIDSLFYIVSLNLSLTMIFLILT